MGLHHAAPGEVVNVHTWGDQVESGKSRAIAKTDRVELIVIDLPTGRELSEHRAPGFITVHCVKGEIEFKVAGKAVTLRRDELLYLEPNEAHSVKAKEDSSLLLTVIR